MSLLERRTQAGTLALTIYDFEAVGDELPVHAHGEETVHITIVARGRVLAFGDVWEMEAAPGVCLDWAPDQVHGIRALEATFCRSGDHATSLPS